MTSEDARAGDESVDTGAGVRKQRSVGEILAGVPRAEQMMAVGALLMLAVTDLIGDVSSTSTR